MKRGEGAGLTPLDGLICAYLALPLLLFCAWFKWPVAIGFAALLLLGARAALLGAWRGELGVSSRLILMIAVVSLAWTALAGLGHFFYANLDWVTRDAVLHDLSTTAWPPQYAARGDEPLILRAPVGFYLPAAAAGAWLGLQAADLLLYLWTALGFALFLCAATTLFSTRRQRLIACAVLIGFGGLDLVGILLLGGTWPQPGEHIEWWAQFAQYSSHSTLMFWVPNHALPAWLGLALVLRHWRQPALARITPLLAAAITLWSPLAALGLAPFFIAGLDWRRDLRQLFSARSGWPLFVIGLVVARYITMDTQALAHGWAVNAFASAGEFWFFYAVFCLLEFGLLAWALVRLGAFNLQLGLAVIILLLLPFYQFGPGNDLAMRSSIPALAVLALATVRPLADAGRSGWRYALMLILGIGAVGAAQEPERALLMPRWAPSSHSLDQLSQEHRSRYIAALPANYVGRLNRADLALLMRSPSPVQASR
ncbi:MAG TPA: hypothetical protein VGM81_08805 [Burkholderiaceae bacterium]